MKKNIQNYDEVNKIPKSYAPTPRGYKDAATALFISRTDLVKNSIIDGNVDTDKFIQFIKIAQQIDIQNLLGTDLYNKIGADIVAGNLSGDYLSLVNDYV